MKHSKTPTSAQTMTMEQALMLVLENPRHLFHADDFIQIPQCNPISAASTASFVDHVIRDLPVPTFRAVYFVWVFFRIFTERHVMYEDLFDRYNHAIVYTQTDANGIFSAYVPWKYVSLFMASAKNCEELRDLTVYLHLLSLLMAVNSPMSAEGLTHMLWSPPLTPMLEREKSVAAVFIAPSGDENINLSSFLDICWFHSFDPASFRRLRSTLKSRIAKHPPIDAAGLLSTPYFHPEQSQAFQPLVVSLKWNSVHGSLRDTGMLELFYKQSTIMSQVMASMASARLK